MKLIAQGLSLSELRDSEALVNEGECAELRLYTEFDLNPDEVKDIETFLVTWRITLIDSLKYDMRVIGIRYRKVQTVELGVLSALSIPIIGWQLFKLDSP